jgi:hypothetical protein
MDPSVAFTELIRAWGPTGAVITLALIVIAFLYKRNQELQDARLNDVKEQLKQVSELVREISKATDDQTQAVSGLRDVVIATSRNRSSGEEG